MEAEKIRNLNPQELAEQQREATEQLFRLKFQMKMGHAGGLKKMRELRKDLARIKTIARERELGLSRNIPGAASETTATPQVKAAKPATAAGGVGNKKKVARKKAATEKK
jgi:large subunit ribosomal protein L29